MFIMDVEGPGKEVTAKVSYFGFKNEKPPADADLVIDCRGIRNPRWWGWSDEYKRSRVMRNPKAYQLVQQGLDHLKSGGKHVAYGCVQGRHRSYAIAHELKRQLELS